MFARTVDAGKGFFVQQYFKVVFVCCSFHQVHEQQVVVIGQVGFLEIRCKFKLVRRHFVVECFGRDAEFVAFYFEFFHEIFHSRRYGAEIMVVELLVFG